MSRAPQFLVVLAVFAASCSHGVKDGVFRKDETAYQVSEPGTGWEEVRLEDNDLAWTSAATGHTLALNSTCEGHDDPPLDVLTRHLLFGFTDDVTVASGKLVMDGRDALRTRFTAKLDGVPVELDLVVLKKDDCVYDFSLVAPVGRGDEKRADFQKVLEGFKVEPRP